MQEFISRDLDTVIIVVLPLPVSALFDHHGIPQFGVDLSHVAVAGLESRYRISHLSK